MVIDVLFVELNRRLEPLLRLCLHNHPKPPFIERMVSPSRSRFSTNHALAALQDVFFSRILSSLHDLVRLDFPILKEEYLIPGTFEAYGQAHLASDPKSAELGGRVRAP